MRVADANAAWATGRRASKVSQDFRESSDTLAAERVVIRDVPSSKLGP